MEPLLEIRNLSVRFPVWGGVLRHKVGEVRAVDDITLTVHRGETLGLVGESGCGKTTTAKAICNLLSEMSPGVIQTGQILFYTKKGPVDILAQNRRDMRPLRAQIQMIFQDPYSSLNPRMTIGSTIERPLILHTRLSVKDRRRRVSELLDRVGLQPEYSNRYPHEFSGGQRQRIGIARALAVEPELIVADEPVSALDVSVQSQVINLLQDLQNEFGLTYVFVAHDLSVVHHISDRIAVMYLGNLVELGQSSQVYHDPLHPYSQALLSAVPQPIPGGNRHRRVKLQGEIPSPLDKPTGCSFHPRCPIAQPDCSVNVPPLEKKETGQLVACPYSSLVAKSAVGDSNKTPS